MLVAERISENARGKHSPVVDVPNFIQATRDSGYRNSAAAFAEFVDNSIEAGATRIDIDLRADADADGEITIEVLDNGCGMTPSELASALQFGGTTRFSSRNGIGRFGMGLPNAAVSQARRVEVLSWQRPSAVWCALLDIDDLTSVGPAARGLMVPAKQRRWVPLTASGTLVRLKKCDRLDTQELDLLTARIRSEFGRIFRDFLFGGKVIVVAGLKVHPSDPLFLRKGINPAGASLYGPPLYYRVKSGAREATVTVRFSELPIADWHALSNEEKSRLGISKRAGVSVLRAGREIDYGWHFMGSKRKENYDDWWRCEINFPAILDEAFGVTNSKQRIRPTDSLAACLVPDIERIARTLNSRVRTTFASLRVEAEAPTLVRAQGRDHLLEPPRLVQKTISSRGFAHQGLRKRNGVVRGMRFQIEPGTVTDEALFSSTRRRDRLVMTLNAEHPFLKKFGELSSGAFQKEDLYLLLLAAARSESCLADSESKKVVRAFLNNWGQTLSAYV
jgi:Histidine kinase-, DNA gyrase B-, and HSP90-like ATPase